MRVFSIFMAAAFAVAAPSMTSAQSAAGVQASLEDGARWIQSVDEALAISQTAYQQSAPKIQALTAAPPTTPAEAKLLGTKLRALIPPMRDGVRQSNAALDRLGPPPALVVQGLKSFGFSSEQIIADARQQNSRLEKLFTALEAMAGAMAIGDAKGVMARLPTIMTGSFDLLDTQAIMIRNRQILVPTTESLHQALGVQSLIYSGMAATARAAVAVQFNAAKPADLALVRGNLETMAQSVARLGMDGRRNVAREKAELAKLTASIERRATPEEITVMQRTQAVVALEDEAFVIADDLYALMRQSAANLAQPKPVQGSLRPLLQPYEMLEHRLVEVMRRQTAAMAGTP